MVMRGTQLEEHVLDVATEVFAEVGCERASMDMIAAQAKTSKRTLYAHFSSKDKLFEATSNRLLDQFLAELGSPGDYVHAGSADDGGSDVRKAMEAYCSGLRAELCTERVLGSCRVVLAEVERLPELVQRVYRTYIGTPRARLLDYARSHAHVDGIGSHAMRTADSASQLFDISVIAPFVRALFCSEGDVAPL